MHIHIHVHTRTYTYIHIHIHVHTRTYTYIHIHIHVHTRTYTYIHVHTHTSSSFVHSSVFEMIQHNICFATIHGVTRFESLLLNLHILAKKIILCVTPEEELK